MPNHTGTNQYGKKEYPPLDVLRVTFAQYEREGLEWRDQLTRLQKEHDLIIEKTTLYKLRKQAGVQTVRRNKKNPNETVQAVLDLKESDVLGRWGVAQVKQRLANEGTFIPRDELRDILHDHFDKEFDSRFAGSKRKRIPRKPLNCLGPWHQEHSDGHEKLAEQALDMGKGIGFPVYANKDQFSSWLHEMLVMPNVRDSTAMVHYYLDLVERRGYRISIQMTTDKGSEVNKFLKIHEELRLEAAPEFGLIQWPAFVQITSTNNTPIESFWRWKREGEGHNIREILIQGRDSGVFSPNDEIHVQTLFWVWVPLIQERLDIFREYHNNHRLSSTKGKILPSRKSPHHMFVAPEAVVTTARDCSIRVNPESVQRIREAYGGNAAREKAFRFITREFEAEADNAYVDLGCPKISLTSAWDIFTLVVKLIEEKRETE